ncbi:MAG: arylesterase [Candidatus Omnitrophica bacterium]|nr:arylesterase [Candidatus Omnitrophota bacterium]
MRFFFERFLPFLFLSSLIFGCSYPIKNLDSSGEVIICFGDSITRTEGIPLKETYPAILSELLHREVINAGIPGDTTTTALRRLEKDVLSKNPYLVVVELGGNDFLTGVSKEVTLKNLEEIIVRIQEAKAIVVLCDISCGFILSGYRRDLHWLAKKTGTIFVPQLLEGILDNPSAKLDYIHPNALGHRLIAQRIYQAIKPYLK